MRNIQSIEDALQGISLLDAIKLIASNIATGQDKNNPNKDVPQPEEDKFLTGLEVDKILKISSVTRHRYANEGILTRHKISKKKIMYKQEEVLKLLAAAEM